MGEKEWLSLFIPNARVEHSEAGKGTVVKLVNSKSVKVKWDSGETGIAFPKDCCLLPSNEVRYDPT